MKIVDVSVVPGLGVQVVTKALSLFAKYKRIKVVPGDISFHRHEIVARKLLPPLIGNYKLISIDYWQNAHVILSQYSWRKV